MTFHPAPPRVTAANPMRGADAVFAAAEAKLPGGPVLVTAPLPFEHVPHLLANVARGRAYVVPILQPNAFTCEPASVSFRCTRKELSRLHDGDVVLATRLGKTDAPVHSFGAITTVEEGGLYVVTVEVALARFDETASIVGYEVLVA